MIHFETDYSGGAHPKVLEKLIETNNLHTVGYGFDEYTKACEETILAACGLTPEASQVIFLPGGTQTNASILDAILEHGDGVICTELGHIATHEAGAVEMYSHKVITLPCGPDGKLTAEQVDAYLTTFYADDSHLHVVRPGAVYISQSTEVGAVYTLAELEALSEVCRKWKVAFYIDGARLAYALGSEGNDVTLKDLARLTTAFYIGGTKAGALFGEAVVFPVRQAPYLFTLLKRHGAIMAKGRLIPLQFQALFNYDLYTEIGRKACAQAVRLRKAFENKGFEPLALSPTNQQFLLLSNVLVQALRDGGFAFENWGAAGKEFSAVRFVTGWMTTDDEIEALESFLAEWGN